MTALAVDVVLVGVGLAAKEASDRFLALPSDLRQVALPQRSVMVDAAGTPIAWFYEQNRSVVPLDQVAPGEDLIGVGADLDVSTLYAAYSLGVFGVLEPRPAGVVIGYGAIATTDIPEGLRRIGAALAA